MQQLELFPTEVLITTDAINREADRVVAARAISLSSYEYGKLKNTNPDEYEVLGAMRERIRRYEAYARKRMKKQ